jgi:diadenosine tetraphosphatase ApaH/serine/threonine PP2A family protein phosphatase
MFDHVKINRAGECEVCGVAHDPDIHEATLAIHDWFRGQVTQYFFDEEEIPAEQVA